MIETDSGKRADPEGDGGDGTGGVKLDLAGLAQRHGIPAISGVVASAKEVLWTGTAGAAREDSIFRIFSMTKPVTSVAAMQLVEERKLELDEPASRWLPELGKLEVLEGFDAAGRPRLRAAKKAVTVRHLLTHTSGFGYEFTSAEILRYWEVTGEGGMADRQKGVLNSPLLFEPGERWQYGVSTDWLGKLVEAVSGLALGEYMKRHIFEPLGMTETGFHVEPQKWGRLVMNYAREADGRLKEAPFGAPKARAFESGGGGLLGTAQDYTKFVQMLLNGGGEVLQRETVEEMGRNQVGRLAAGRLKTSMPQYSLDADFHPGHDDGWGLGLLINETAYEHGRSAGSLGWAGVANTFFWVDRQKGIAGVLLMQVLPFFDGPCIAALRAFERAVYG